MSQLANLVFFCVIFGAWAWAWKTKVEENGEGIWTVEWDDNKGISEMDLDVDEDLGTAGEDVDDGEDGGLGEGQGGQDTVEQKEQDENSRDKRPRNWFILLHIPHYFIIASIVLIVIITIGNRLYNIICFLVQYEEVKPNDSRYFSFITSPVSPYSSPPPSSPQSPLSSPYSPTPSSSCTAHPNRLIYNQPMLRNYWRTEEPVIIHTGNISCCSDCHYLKGVELFLACQSLLDTTRPFADASRPNSPTFDDSSQPSPKTSSSFSTSTLGYLQPSPTSPAWGPIDAFITPPPSPSAITITYNANTIPDSFFPALSSIPDISTGTDTATPRPTYTFPDDIFDLNAMEKKRLEYEANKRRNIPTPFDLLNPKCELTKDFPLFLPSSPEKKAKKSCCCIRLFQWMMSKTCWKKKTKNGNKKKMKKGDKKGKKKGKTSV